MERFDFISGPQNNYTSWHKHVMEKHVLSGQNLSLARQMTCLMPKIICRLVYFIMEGPAESVFMFAG